MLSEVPELVEGLILFKISAIGISKIFGKNSKNIAYRNENKFDILRISQNNVYLCSVIVTFEQTYLKELYDEGKTRDKKHRFQPDIVKRYQQRIKTLEAAPRIETLYQIKSLNYEVLSGEKAGISSIRVNDKYRIEFVVSLLDNPVVTICNILELSNHYK